MPNLFCMNETSSPNVTAAWSTIEIWMKHVHNRDIDSVVSLYCETHNAFWGTFANHLRCPQSEVRTYFDSFLDVSAINCAIVSKSARQLSENVIAFSGSYEFTITTNDGIDKKALARYTFTVRKDDETPEWKIVEHHSSVMPENGF